MELLIFESPSSEMFGKIEMYLVLATAIIVSIYLSGLSHTVPNIYVIVYDGVDRKPLSSALVKVQY